MQWCSSTCGMRPPRRRTWSAPSLPIAPRTPDDPWPAHCCSPAAAGASRCMARPTTTAMPFAGWWPTCPSAGCSAMARSVRCSTPPGCTAIPVPLPCSGKGTSHGWAGLPCPVLDAFPILGRFLRIPGFGVPPHMSLCRLASACALLLLPLASPAQQARPFTAEAMLQLRQVSEPVLSPDGSQVVYNVRSIDLDANRGQLDLWSLDITRRDATPRQLTTHPQNDYSAQWSRDGRSLYSLSSRRGSTQLWRLPAAGGEARQVTNLPLDVTSYQLSPAGSHLAVTLDVFADCDDLACTAQRLERTPEDSAQAYERLLVRHWDTWKDGRISQLFVLALDEPEAPVPVSAALDADVPSKPFGDASEYTFSPDGSKLVFSARVKGNSE